MQIVVEFFSMSASGIVQKKNETTAYAVVSSASAVIPQTDDRKPGNLRSPYRSLTLYGRYNVFEKT